MARPPTLLLAILSLLLALAPPAVAQTELTGIPASTPPSPAEAAPADASPAGMDSPRATVEGFLGAWRARAAGQLDDAGVLLRALPDSYATALDNAGLRAADRLGEVLDRGLRPVAAAFAMGVPIDPMSRIPGAGELPPGAATWDLTLLLGAEGETARSHTFPMARGADGAWRFTEAAVGRAAELHAELFADRYFLRRAFNAVGMGGLVEHGALGMRYYQWASLFALLFFAVTLDFAVRMVVALVARRYLKRDEDRETQTDTPKLIRRAARPFGLTAAGLLVYLLLPLIEMPTTGEGILLVAAKVFTLFGGLLASYRIVDLAGEFFQRRASHTETKVDDVLIPLVRKAVKIFLLAFGLIFIAESLNLPVTSLVAGFGIAGAAVAFASKDTIENLFGSVAVILDRPFHVGDWVVIGDVEGIVEELGFRSTRVRTFYNSLVTVPNSSLVRATVDNYGRRRYRRYSTRLGVTYSTPPDRIEAFCEGIREIVRRSPATRKDYFEIHLNAFGENALEILVYVFFRVPDWSAELRSRHRFCLDIIRLAERLGVEFAFPTQTLHVVREPDAPADAPPFPDTPDDDARAAGRDAAGAVLARSDAGA